MWPCQYSSLWASRHSGCHVARFASLILWQRGHGRFSVFETSLKELTPSPAKIVHMLIRISRNNKKQQTRWPHPPPRCSDIVQMEFRGRLKPLVGAAGSPYY